MLEYFSSLFINIPMLHDENLFRIFLVSCIVRLKLDLLIWLIANWIQSLNIRLCAFVFLFTGSLSGVYIFSESVNFFPTHFTTSLNFFPISCTPVYCSLLNFFPNFNLGWIVSLSREQGICKNIYPWILFSALFMFFQLHLIQNIVFGAIFYFINIIFSQSFIDDFYI